MLLQQQVSQPTGRQALKNSPGRICTYYRSTFVVQFHYLDRGIIDIAHLVYQQVGTQKQLAIRAIHTIALDRKSDPSQLCFSLILCCFCPRKSLEVDSHHLLTEVNNIFVVQKGTVDLAFFFCLAVVGIGSAA